MYWYGLALVAAAIHTRTSHMTSAALKPCYSVVDAQHSLPWRRTSVQMAKTSVTLLCYLGWSQLPPEEQEITLCFSAKHIGVTLTWHENYAVVHHLHLMQSQGKKAADKNAHNISSYKFLDVTDATQLYSRVLKNTLAILLGFSYAQLLVLPGNNSFTSGECGRLRTARSGFRPGFLRSLAYSWSLQRTRDTRNRK